MREPSMIDLAVRTGTTGFGDQPLSLRSEKTSVTITQRAIGPEGKGHRTASREVSWLINGDGTATCEQARLMWIQAPWGMQWEGGSRFSGKPCPVSWIEAQRLFGRGVRVGLATDDDTIGLSANQIRSTAVEAGYSRGTCRIVFAGYSDWRLPTLADWYTVIGLESEKRLTVLQLGYDPDCWTATERHERIHDYPILAFFGLRHNCAWAANVDRWILDRQVEERLRVMFVRTA